MTGLRRLVAILLFCIMILPFIAAGAEDAAQDVAAPAEEKTLIQEAIDEGVAEEDLPVDDEQAVSVADENDMGSPSIQGLSPLYRTKIKLMTATGNVASIRYAQDTDSQVLGQVGKGKEVTIYKVYPSFVLVEYEGTVGYVLRTCIDENCTVLDPSTTPPYGVMPMSYVATLTEDAYVYQAPRVSEEINPIILGKGNRIAIIEFVNGFAKIYYWRGYGYVDARLLTNMTVVAPTIDPMSSQTPIAAFSSYFAYNTGAEGNEGRCKNIVRSCELMTRVMQPGEQLDFNAQIGPYKKSNGYFPAPVLIDGGTQLGYGGGTCQSSSTLYNTIRQLPGISILYRRPHGPGSARYLPQHTDAAVGNVNLNLVFRNDYDFPIRILAESDGRGVLTIQIFKGDNA
ncbi:MAG: SH3 domain-containing protein [Clostridiales bacterium]|nr:SH3 domain-containing protein [Clostridiales bacterium]